MTGWLLPGAAKEVSTRAASALGDLFRRGSGNWSHCCGCWYGASCGCVSVVERVCVCDVNRASWKFFFEDGREEERKKRQKVAEESSLNTPD